MESIKQKLSKCVGRETDRISDPIDGSTPVKIRSIYEKYGSTYIEAQALSRKRRKFNILVGSGDVDVLIKSCKKI